MKKKYRGSIEFSIYDDREDEFNQSVSLSKDLYYDEMDDLISIMEYKDYCIRFAKVVGWSDKLIEEVFKEEG